MNYGSVFSNSLVGVGTLAYASPEQLGERVICKNADLWSFGVIAFQVLTDELPFTTGTYAATSEAGRLELFRQISSGVLPDAANHIAGPWQQLIRACLVTDPDRRVRSVQKCLDMLNEVQSQKETPTRVDPIDDINSSAVAIGDNKETPTLVDPLVSGADKPVIDQPSKPEGAEVKDKTPEKLGYVRPHKPFPWKKAGWIAGCGMAVLIACFAVLSLLPEPAQLSTAPPKPDPDIVVVPASVEPAESAWTSEYTQSINRAQTYYNNENYTSAKAEYNKALRLIPAIGASDKKDYVTQRISECNRQIQAEEDRRIAAENERRRKEEATEAAKWFRQSAEQGNADAQYRLGLMYLQGRGVTPDFTEAAKWFRRSAEQGRADAQVNLGWMYEKGYGVQKDKEKAIEWYQKAVKLGNDRAKDDLRRLGITSDDSRSI